MESNINPQETLLVHGMVLFESALFRLRISLISEVVVLVSFVLQFSSVTSDYFSMSFSLCQSC